MKSLTAFMLIILVQVFFAKDVSALTLAECDQTGGKCICIAHPGAEPVCTRSKEMTLTQYQPEKDMWSFQNKEFDWF